MGTWYRPDQIAEQVQRHPSHTGYYAWCPERDCNARVTGVNRAGTQSALTDHLVVDHGVVLVLT